MAIEWCADTYAATVEDTWYARFQYFGPWTVTSTQDCGWNDPRPFGYFSEKRANAIIEHDQDARVPWLLPMVVAREGTVTWSPDPEDNCGLAVETYSLDAISKAAVPGVNLDQHYDYFASVNPYARCGVAQRSWSWNRSCAESFAGINMTPRPSNSFDPNTGAFAFEYLAMDPRSDQALPMGTMCYLREPRRYATCPMGLTCTAGGECVANRAPANQVLNLDAPAAGGTGGT